MDPYDLKTRSNKLGTKVIKRGEMSFFIQPGEHLEEGILNIHILSEQEAALVKATENFVQRIIPDDRYDMVQKAFKESPKSMILYQNIRNGNIRVLLDTEKNQVKDYEQEYTLKTDEKFEDYVKDVSRSAGDRWMEYGPATYLPPVEVMVLDIIKEIPLDVNEGIYVKDTRTGEVRAEIGRPYMLRPHEQLTEIDISQEFEDILVKENNLTHLDKTRVITYRCPFNSASQIYDYKAKTSRIIYGPDLVLLQPEEIITINVLSGGKPKRKGAIKTLSLNLGPDFTSDLIEVETSDHAKLSIKLAYNWHFGVNKEDPKDSSKLFAIQDFIGDMCTIMAAKIRSTVASVTFETFHKSFARLIRTSIFGINEQGKIKPTFTLDKNNLVLTNVDIQSVEPIDQKTRKSLKETVSMAIDITTKSQEEQAKRKTEQIQQESKGSLERLKIQFDAKAENSKKQLLQFQNESKSIQNTGAANAEARARTQANLMKAEAKVELSKLTTNAQQAERNAKYEREKQIYKNKLEHEQKMNDLEIERKEALAQIESQKFSDIVNAIGQETLVAISRSKVDTQVQLMEGLGLKGYLMTDGQTPVNLYSAAGGLFGDSQTTQK